jgi:ABC-type phosphate transport system permease subunit
MYINRYKLRYLVALLASFSTVSYGRRPGIFLRTADQIMEPLTLFIIILHNVCWIIGGAFVMGAIVRYLQRRYNPGQGPISQSIFLGVLGLVLILLPFMTRYAIPASVQRSLF